MKLLQFQPSSCDSVMSRREGQTEESMQHPRGALLNGDSGVIQVGRIEPTKAGAGIQSCSHDSLSPFIGAFWATLFSSPVWALAIWGFCHFSHGGK